MKGRTALYVALPLAGILVGFTVAWVADAPRRERYEGYGRVREGMTYGEVIEILGPPQVGLGSKGESSLQWGDGQETEFSVHIPDETHHVRRVAYWRRDAWGDHLRRMVGWLGF